MTARTSICAAAVETAAASGRFVRGASVNSARRFNGMTDSAVLNEHWPHEQDQEKHEPGGQLRENTLTQDQPAFLDLERGGKLKTQYFESQQVLLYIVS